MRAIIIYTSSIITEATLCYIGFGTRVDRVVGSTVETWKRAGAGVTASVLNDGVANFTPGISSRVGSTSTFTHAGLKNMGAQSEFNGNTPAISGTKTYDAFGLETATTGTWKTAFGYAGNFGYQKTDGGMKLLGHRYYDPETGRFLSRDPIKDGRNWYAYGAGSADPITGIDPSGLTTIVMGVPVVWTGPSLKSLLGRVLGWPVAVSVALAGLLVWLADQALEQVYGKPGVVADEGTKEAPGATGGPSLSDPDIVVGPPDNSLPVPGPETTEGSVGVRIGENGEVIQIRVYDPDGTPRIDIDFGHDHGYGIPHIHRWPGGKRGGGIPVPGPGHIAPPTRLLR